LLNKSRKNSFYYLIATTIIVLPLIIGIAYSFITSLNNSEKNFRGDQALIEIYTLNALHGKQLLGPYSRLNWNHLGPAYFYMLAPIYILMNCSSFGLLIGAMIINIAAIMLILIILKKHTDIKVFSIASIILAIYLCSITSQLLSFWSPRVTYLPFMGFIYLCALVAFDKKWAFPLMFFIGSFIIQNHLMYVPTVAVLIATAITINLASKIKKKKAIFKEAKMQWLASLLILLIMWTPPLIEEVNNSPGNMSKIAHFFLDKPTNHSKAEPSIAFNKYIRRYGRIPVSVIDNLNYFEQSKNTKNKNIATLTFFVVIITASIISLFIALRRKKWFFFYLLLMCLMATATSIWSAFQIIGRVRNHMVFWSSTLSIISITAIVGTFLPQINEYFAKKNRSSKKRGNIKIVTILILISITSLTTFQMFFVHKKHFITDKLYDYTDITDSVSKYIRDNNITRPVLTVIDKKAYRLASMIFLNLYKRDVKFLVKGRRSYIFRGTLKSTKKEKDYIAIATRANYKRLIKRTDYHFITKNTDLCIFGFTSDKKKPKSLTKPRNR